MKYKSTKAALYMTVALSTIFINAFVANDAIAAEIFYRGTEFEYGQLPVDKILAPPINGSQSGNTIEVSDSTPVGEVFYAPSEVRGGYSSVASVENNRVKILSGTITGDVYGGYISGFGTRNVTANRVEISTGTIGGNVYGGYSSGNATLSVANNHVVISAGAIGGNVYGGHSTGFGTRNVTDNHVVISAGTIVANVYGGSGIGANFVKKNSVNISDGTINGSVYGGYSSGLGAFLVTENEVIISAGAIDGDVYGGRGTPFDGGILNVTDNRVYISGGAITGVVYGGSGASSVTGNDVVIDGDAMVGNVYGGTGTWAGNGSGASNVKNNSVVISNAAKAKIVYGGASAYNASGTFAVQNNSVVISGAATIESIYGGHGSGTDAFNVIDNNIKISGGTITGDVSGGSGMGNGSFNVKNNDVNISGGRIAGNVYGGFGRGSGAFTVNNNSVVISGGIIEDSVYGGYAFGDGSVTAINNTVTLKNNAVVHGGVYGGYAALSPLNDVVNEFNAVVSGNTLNLNEYHGSVAGIYNFENYNWLLPSNVANGDVLIHIDGNNDVNLNRTNHTFNMINDGAFLRAGDKIILIDKATGSPNEVPTQVEQMQQGLLIVYDVDIGVDGDGNFVLKVADEAEITPRAKAFLEGRAAALGFVRQGSDLIATAGIDNVRMMVRSKDEEFKGLPLTPFIIMQGASNRYNSGSHADVDGFNMAVGLATGGELEQGNKVSLGTFFEYGRGTYNTYNSFANHASVRGYGDVHYAGGGVFGRMEFAGTGLGRVANLAPTQADGLYLEASLRGGRVSMGFDSGDLIDAEGYRGNYNSKLGYIGGHASVGYAFNFDEKQALNVHGRYLWTRMNGDTVTVGKDTVHFDRSTSSRMQLGGRYSYAYTDQLKPYIGAAYEYEFAGDIGATAYGLRLDEPSLKGSTGIIEAGFSFTPDAKIPDLSINVNAQAFFGQRQGGSGEVKFKYQF